MGSTLQRLRERLSGVVPDAELQVKAEIADEIIELKTSLNAVILAHNYMEPALYHSIPDFTGDSLELSRRAATTDADIIVFCGVKFMAETAKILNPTKQVLLPAEKAGCSLAAGITADDVRSLRRRFPGVPVVTYINTYADVKAESDICCTSGNAAEVVRSLNTDTVIFLPDEYLARNVAAETGRRVISARSAQAPGDGPSLIAWDARCEVHERFTVEDVTNARAQFDNLLILAHPECSPDVCAAVDFTGSTKEMISYIRQSGAHRYLLLTECSMADNIIHENPQAEMVRYCSIRCPHMNLITLEDTLASLRTRSVDIQVPTDIAVRARTAVQRMLTIG